MDIELHVSVSRDVLLKWGLSCAVGCVLWTHTSVLRDQQGMLQVLSDSEEEEAYNNDDEDDLGFTPPVAARSGTPARRRLDVALS